MTQISRRSFNQTALFGSLSAVMLAAAGCAPASSGTSGGAASTSTDLITLALDQDFVGFDHAKLPSGSAAVQAWQAVYDTLLVMDSNGNVVPNLAESFEFNDAHTVLTLKLRQGVKFHDGTVLDAAAAQASLEHMKTGGGPDSGRLADVTITAPDATTLVLTSSAPNGLLPMWMAMAPGIVASPASLKSADLEINPVGSGPYKIDASATTSGATYTFVRNAEHWNKSAFPYEKLVFKVMTDISARVSALKSGQINGTNINSQSAAEVKASATLLESHVQWAGLILGDRNGRVIPALGEVKVRQAINMVFDRPAIVKALFQGQGKVTNQIFNDRSEAFLPDMIEHYPYDVEKAKSLMAEAGYPDGFELTIPSITGLDFANPIIVQQLGLIGIKVQQTKLSGPQAFPDIFAGKYPVFFFIMDTRTPLYDIVGNLPVTGTWNINRAVDPELNPLLEKAQIATGAEAESNAQAINKMIIEKAWFCPWALPTNFYATDKKTSAEPDFGNNAPNLSSFKPSK